MIVTLNAVGSNTTQFLLNRLDMLLISRSPITEKGDIPLEYTK